jgi:hypothetical protein
MAARFVNVPADAVRDKLLAAGFTRTTEAWGNEEVYDRPHDRDAHYVVRVFSSIHSGAEEARQCGADAIRVVAVHTDDRFRFPPRSIVIFKAARVFRTGTVEKVLGRMVDRAREAYSACNEHRKEKRP